MEGQAVRERSGRGWGHSHADTFDRLDGPDLRDLSVVLSTAVLKLARGDRPVEAKSRKETREVTIEDGYVEGMRKVGYWPFEDLK